MNDYIEHGAAINSLTEDNLVLNLDSVMDGLSNQIKRSAHRILASLPAADVEPVRHGRWIWNQDGMDWGLGAWCCSECKSKAETWWANDSRYNPLHCSGGHFCGNCGARMDGDGDV